MVCARWMHVLVVRRAATAYNTHTQLTTTSGELQSICKTLIALARVAATDDANMLCTDMCAMHNMHAAKWSFVSGAAWKWRKRTSRMFLALAARARLTFPCCCSEWLQCNECTTWIHVYGFMTKCNRLESNILMSRKLPAFTLGSYCSSSSRCDHNDSIFIPEM